MYGKNDDHVIDFAGQSCNKKKLSFDGEGE
jgi:hypothetical protein